MDIVLMGLIIAMGLGSVSVGLRDIADAIKSYPHIQNKLKEQSK